jgi:hypothetical protein
MLIPHGATGSWVLTVKDGVITRLYVIVDTPKLSQEQRVLDQTETHRLSLRSRKTIR